MLKITAVIMLVAVFAAVFNPCEAQAKAVSDQDNIILLNDSASALEDTDPGLSKRLTQFADEKEKEWEYKNANKDAPAVVITAKDIPRLQDQIKLLKAAVHAIGATYPLITQGLRQMIKDDNKAIENVQ